MLRFTAKIYFDDKVVDQLSGDDVDELYNWMLVKVQGKFGNLNGDIIENKTKQVIKSFSKSSTE